MWNWVKRIMNVIKRPITKAIETKRDVDFGNRIKELDERIRLRKQSPIVSTPSVKQTKVESQETPIHAIPEVLILKDIESIDPTMMSLYRKHKREDREKKARKAAELMISDIQNCINTKDINGARLLYAEAKSILMEYGTKKLNLKLTQCLSLIQDLQSRIIEEGSAEIRDFENALLKEKEDLRQKKIEEEIINREQEKALREKAMLDSESYLRRLEEKEIAEMKRKKHLKNAHVIIKKDREQIKALLQENGIRFLYHITDSRNLFWIKKYGGLLSYQYMKDEDIMSPFPGSTTASIQRNEELNTSNYIKLSICVDKTVLNEMKNKGITPMILSFRPDNIVSYANTRFANESILRDSVRLGDNVGFLQNEIDWEQVQNNRVYSREPFGFSSPEILVRTFIDINEILNINNPKYV